MCLFESLRRVPLCNCTSGRMKFENLSQLQNTAMGGKGEAWKVLSLTHVEYKVGWRLSILTMSVGDKKKLFSICSIMTYWNDNKHYFEFLAMLQEDDPMGKMFAIYSLLPLVIVIVFATTFFIRCYPQHEVHYPYLFLKSGETCTPLHMQLASSLITLETTPWNRCVVLLTHKYQFKSYRFNFQYLAEPRPMKRDVQFEEFGMPSSHRFNLS